mgnify:CR=1 FL=1
MAGSRQLYRRLDGWARGLSRVRYALLTGAVVTASVLSVGLVLDATTTVRAVTMGAVMAALYYAGDVNADEA